MEAAYKSVPATLAAVLEGEHLQDCGRVLALWLVLMKRFGDRPADMLAAARALVPPYQPARGVVLPTATVNSAAAAAPTLAVPAAETLWELLARHASAAPHGGVRRAALYLMAACFGADLELQRCAVVGRAGPGGGDGSSALAAGGAPVSFRWAEWWVGLVPWAAHRNWEARWHLLQLDRRYAFEVRPVRRALYLNSRFVEGRLCVSLMLLS